MSLPRSSKNGFTLVELAIVLVIVGILVAMGAAMIGPLSNMARIRETKDTLEADSQAITSWASANNRLPDTTSVPATNPVLFNNVAKTPNDAWGRPVVYLYDSAFTTAPITKDTICGRRAASLTVTTVSPQATISNVAFVLLSGAGNPAPQSTLGGAPIAGSGAANGTITQDPAVNDILRWVTLDELRTKVGCQGAPLKIVNNELPYGQVTNIYTATITADGGVPFPTGYKWCVNSPLPVGFVSPPAGGIVNADCLSANEAAWGAASPNLTISFPANAVGLVAGSNQITVVVRDNADGVTTSAACNSAAPGDNCAQKVFVITVNPF